LLGNKCSQDSYDTRTITLRSWAKKVPFVMRFSFPGSDRVARPEKVSGGEGIGNVFHFTASTCGKRFPIRCPLDTDSFAPCLPFSSLTADRRRLPREMRLLLPHHALRTAAIISISSLTPARSLLLAS
jgi:hypothetical protein